MILADKIVTLRKKAGWSQEELAQQLNVTRQSVSKWEGAQSIPDMEKILQMSRIFGVTIDFLLKDEMETAEAAPETETTAARRVTMEEAFRYLELRRQAAPKMALATLLCVLSPAALLMLSAVSQQTTRFGISEETAGSEAAKCRKAVGTPTGKAVPCGSDRRYADRFRRCSPCGKR